MSADTTDPRYPVGRFAAPEAVTPVDRATFIDQIAETPARLRDAVSGLDGALLDTPYREGGWTVRQLVHHVADSHMNAYTRFRLALTEDTPTIKPYDQEAWSRLPDSRLAIDVSLRIIDAVHERWVTMLRGLSESDFARAYFHPESGRTTLDQALAQYAWHGRHHTAHVMRLRERMSRPSKRGSVGASSGGGARRRSPPPSSARKTL
jgi:uncharacterized damage-inducible protein DinB